MINEAKRMRFYTQICNRNANLRLPCWFLGEFLSNFKFFLLNKQGLPQRWDMRPTSIVYTPI